MSDEFERDDHVDPDVLLVSAYVDGDVDDEARAAVEGSEPLSALAAQMRAVRTTLADVEVADSAQRDNAIAAALGAWQADAGGDSATSSGSSATIVPMVRRSRVRAGLAAVAAAVVVALAGVSIARVGDDDDSDDTAGEAALEATVEHRDAATSTQVASDAGATAGAADDSPTIAGPATVETPDDTLAVAGAPSAVTAATSAPPSLLGPDDLAAYASSFEGAEPSADTAGTCGYPGEQILGDVVYAGQPAVAALDPPSREAVAFEPTRCTELARVPLP